MSLLPTFTMRRQRTVLIALIVATACVIVAVLLARSREPTYAGYPLSNWVKLLSEFNEQDFGPDCTHDKAPDAILAIGTNALPFFVEWLSYEGGPTPVRDAINWSIEKVPVLGKIHGLEQWAFRDTRLVRSAGSLVAFRILGPTAAPAIPELVRRATKNVHSFSSVQQDAVYALTGIGEPAFPALLNIATNRAIEGFTRGEAARSLGSFGTNAAPAIPVLLDVLEGDELFAAEGAAESLAAIGLKPRRVVPALERAALRPWDTHEFIFALTKFGTNAVDAIPVLQKIAEGDDKFSRMFALSAISKIRTNNVSSSAPGP